MIFGIGSFLKNLATYLTKEFDVEFLLLKGLKYHGINKNQKVRFFGFGINHPKPLKIMNRIISHNQISQQFYDLLYWPHQQIYFFQKPKSKFIFTLHDLIPLIFPQWHSKFNVIFDYKIMLRKAAKYAEKIICISNTTKNDFIRFFGREFEKKVVVIYNGINTDIYYPRKKKEVKKVKAKFGIEKEYILYTGGFHPRKNVETLLRAFDIVREKYDIQLVLTGEGLGVFKNFDQTYFRMKHKKDILILGFVEEKFLPALYTGAKLYINPSFYEGFGLGPLEALACGTQVIVSDIPVTRELLPTIIKFEPTDYHELAYVILEELEQNRKNLHTVKKIRSKYDWAKTAYRYKEVFENLIRS